ncbi:MAG TPA: general secretion pathway protein GspB [Lysobacter sp.]|nr:general secretion pathway protein GspB [Lysobacter sp.]
MSLILEALRKSEAERRRGQMPDLRAELPPPAATQRTSLRRASPWIAVVVALGIALLFGLKLASRDTAKAPDRPPATTPAPVESVRMQPRAVIAQTPPTPRIVEREAPKKQSAPPVATPIPPPQIAPPPAPSAATETSINALSADLRKALPPLQLSMHMWNPDPAKRFVILDGQRYAEGDSVGPMRIRRIDADGVLFDWQGRAVRLPLR